MAEKYSKIRFPIIALTITLGFVVIGVVATLQLIKNPDYRLSGAGLVVAVALPIAAHVMRGKSSSSPGHLKRVARELAAAVQDQGSRSVIGITDPYPLQVPFSVMTTAAVDLTDVRPRTEGMDVSPGGSGAQLSPSDVLLIPTMDTWASIRDQPNAGPLVLDGAFEDIATVFTSDGLHKRMVILGEPGSGKSMIAQWLTVELLKSHPEMGMVPVVLSPATWNPREPLEGWAAAQMAKTYPYLSNVVQAAGNMERTLAYQLITGNRVLMILDGLDGLDEMAAGNQPDALQRLSEFAESGQHFVVTCRTKDYARIVFQAGTPLARTPVIALGPLAIDDVIQYLRDTPLLRGPSAGRWARFFQHLVIEPDGPLAMAMTSPLVVGLVRAIYEIPETRPDELLDISSVEEITDFLFGGIIDAAYAVPVFKENRKMYVALKPEDRKIKREQLVYFADYLDRQIPVNGNNIEWWHLPRDVPKWFVGGTIGMICGCLLGASGGLAVAIKFGHSVGLVVGIVLGIVAAIHAGTTTVGWQDVPRSISFSAKIGFPRLASCLAVAIGIAVCFGYAADRGGGILAALITAAVVGPLCATAIKPTFGTRPAITTAISASLALGLAASLFGQRPAPLISAAAAGLTFLVSGWVFTGIFQNASRTNASSTKAVSPESLLRGDRNGSLIVALTADLAFAVVFGLALGPLVGLLAFASLAITAAFTVSIWGAFTLTRIWLRLFRGMPLAIMDFLREADARGVLRCEGGAFQFRYVKLQEQLLALAALPVSMPDPTFPPDAERNRNQVRYH